MICYGILQLIRNVLVYCIRKKWIVNCDERLYLYKYEEMMEPSISNWFGFRIPMDRHYKHARK